jgi:hypothetical protein
VVISLSFRLVSVVGNLYLTFIILCQFFSLSANSALIACIYIVMSIFSLNQHHHSMLKIILEFILWIINLIKYILIKIIAYNVLPNACNEIT